jgi:hypothetical protein
MTSLQRAGAEREGDWKVRVQEQFRRTVLDRIEAYLAGRKVGPYEDHSGQVWPADEFARLVEHSEFLVGHAPTFAAYLCSAPTRPIPDVESFLYWSKERVANRPIISVTDVEILRGQGAGMPDALVAGKELFSTHYVNASFGLTALVRGEAGGSNYLVYVNRSEVDVLHGMFGGVVRGFIQRRVKAEATSVLRGLRQRLESGEPPGVEPTSR